MICNVDKLINHWFEDLHIDDFKLTRFDITKDIQGIPEPVIQEYIMMMRRHFTPDIFELNTPLEENTQDFREYDSFNALKKDEEQKQKEVEFVVYNKHRAGIDQQLSSSELEYYSDTMRLEIRCLKKYFKERTKDFTTSRALMYLFKRREDIAQSVYKEVLKSFEGFTNTSFIQYSWQKKFINCRTKKKVKKREKMLWLTKKLRKKSTPTVHEALSLYNKKERAKERLICYFEEIGFSPVPINNKNIPFMQSLRSILGFEEPSEHDKELYDILSRDMGGRKPVLYNTFD